MELRGLNDTEDLVYQTIMNDPKLHDEVEKLKFNTLSHMLIELDKIIEHIDEDFSSTHIVSSVLFAHLISDMGHKIAPSVLKHLEEMSKHWKTPELKPGDPINHLNSSLSFCTDAVILDEDVNNSNKWYVSYTNERHNKVQGFWLKNRCVLRDTVKQISPEIQCKPAPLIIDFDTKKRWQS